MWPVLVALAWFSAEPEPVVLVPETQSELIDAWDEDTLNCNFWNSTTRYQGRLCSHFSITRLASTIAEEALIRALKCGAAHEVDCVLAPEVGVNLPSCFVYDDEDGFKMIVAPKIISAHTEKRIKLVHPITEEGTEHTFNTSISIEYLPSHSRAPVSAELSGIAAYCVQLLRHSFSDTCWQSLD